MVLGLVCCGRSAIFICRRKAIAAIGTLFIEHTLGLRLATFVVRACIIKRAISANMQIGMAHIASIAKSDAITAGKQFGCLARKTLHRLYDARSWEVLSTSADLHAMKIKVLCSEATKRCSNYACGQAPPLINGPIQSIFWISSRTYFQRRIGRFHEKRSCANCVTPCSQFHRACHRLCRARRQYTNAHRSRARMVARPLRHSDDLHNSR